jgi:hypothetical protein
MLNVPCRKIFATIFQAELGEGLLGAYTIWLASAGKLNVGSANSLAKAVYKFVSGGVSSIRAI